MSTGIGKFLQALRVAGVRHLEFHQRVHAQMIMCMLLFRRTHMARSTNDDQWWVTWLLLNCAMCSETSSMMQVCAPQSASKWFPLANYKFIKHDSSHTCTLFTYCASLCFFVTWIRGKSTVGGCGRPSLPCHATWIEVRSLNCLEPLIGQQLTT